MKVVDRMICEFYIEKWILLFYQEKTYIYFNKHFFMNDIFEIKIDNYTNQYGC